MEMKALLSFMDTEDKEQALRYYERMFEMSGEDGEEALLEDFGTPLRQVLQLEKRYRERQESGLPLFDEEEFPAEAPEETTAEELPAEDGDGPDYGEEADWPEEELPAEDADEPDYQEAAAVEAGAEDASAEQPAAENAAGADTAAAEEDGGAYAPYDELPAQVLSDAAGEMLAGIDFGAEEPGEEEAFFPPEEETYIPPEEETYIPPESGDDKPSGARVAAAVLLSPFLVLLAAAGVLLSLALAAVPLALCALSGAVSLYLALYAVTSMSYLPDMLLVLGVAVGLLALTVFFLWAGLALLVSGIGRTIRLIAALFGRVLGKGGK